MNKQRRQLMVAAGSMGAWAGFSSHAQGLPEVARILAGFPPGGTVDTAARRLADRLRDVVAKSVVVENRPGAGGQIALSALKAAAPDGLTLLVTPMGMLAVYPHTYRKLPYDPVVDYTPISQAVHLEFGFAVGPAVPASVNNVKDFVAWSKANPKDASFSSPAAGSVPHFVGELFARAAGFDLKHVPYRGAQPALTDMMGGQVAAMSGAVGDYLPHLATGRVRILATSGTSRNRFTPNVPTFVEQGYKDLVFDEWFGVYAPAKLPAAMVETLSTAVRGALKAPDLVEAFAKMGLEARGSTSAELAAMQKRDGERWAPLVKTIGFTAES